MTDIKFKEGGSKYRMNVYNSIERNLRSYSGFTSLLKELIQNSDDSYIDGEGVEIGVYFLDEKLKFTNNTVFDENDWNQIEEIGSMNKDEDSKKTGRFGIGFTSVFKICDYLDIHSNNISKRLSLEEVEYNWRTYEEPRIVGNNTEFELFWRFEESEVREKIGADITSPEQIKTKFIPDTLKYIYNEIHFLKNVTQIVIYEDDKLLQKISIEKKCEDINQKILKETNTITTINDASDIKNSIRLIYHKNIEDNFFEEYQTKVARRKPLLLSIAINASELKNGYIYCTLPTKEPTKFKFDINCDFQPDPNRKRLIYESDDRKGQYNLKLLSFIPELLYEILDNLKINIAPQQFYEILSEASNTFNDEIYSNNDFISKIQNNDIEIIFIDDEWHPISETRIIGKMRILFLLKRMDYPIISEKFLKFKDFFDSIGVVQFDIQDLIRLIEDKIPKKVSFDDSIFESKDELKSVFEYVSINSDYKDYISELGMLNIFLTMDGDLNNTSQIKIYNVPSSLKLIENDLDIDKIDKVIFDDFKDLLLMLGVQKFTSMDLIEIMYNDFIDQTYPLNLLQSKSYINSKDKIRKIIGFISSDLEKYQNNLLDQNTDEYNKLEKCNYLPLIVDDKDQLYPLKNSIDIFNLDSDLKKRFALKYNILDVTVVHDIVPLLPDYKLSKSLTLDLIFAKVQEYIESDLPLDEDDLALLYELILEGESQLKQSNIKNIIETTPIFRNNDGELCSLINNGKRMKLIGSYTNPIKIKEILDEKLIKKISNFKEKKNIPDFRDILKRYFVEELTFEIYIKEHFQDVFDSESVNTEQKLQLIEELNEQFLRIENDLDIIEVLKNTKFVYCQDNQFYRIDENNLFFKSDEIKNFFGNDYLYPNFHDIEKYAHLLKKIGVKEELKPSQIVNYVISLTENANINAHLIKKLKNVFTYINKHWNNFQDTNEFKKLSDIEWLPAINSEYLFTWDEIQSDDNVDFIKFITDCYGDEFTNDITILKNDDENTITVSNETESLNLKLNYKKTKVTLTDNENDEHVDFIAKNENGKLNIYNNNFRLNNDFRLYKPSDPNLFTHDSKIFLFMYEDILYLDLKEIKKGFIDVLGLKNISKISTSMIVQNLKLNYESREQHHIDGLSKIYFELSKRLKNDLNGNKHSILELKNFPSFYVAYKNTTRYFYPDKIFTKDCHKRYGYEYIGYLEPELVKKCNELINLLGILEEPEVDTLKFILEQIDSKYEKNEYQISQNDDKKILENCLEQLNKSIGTLDSEFISELQRIHIFCNSENKLITPEESILDDRPRLSKEFKDKLGNHFIKYQIEKVDLINKLKIDRLSQIIKKELEVKPEPNQLKKDDNLTNKLRFLSELMPRIKAEKTDLDKSKWSHINQDIIVFIFDKLRVRRYVKFGNSKYDSSNKNIQCYVNKKGNKFVEMYIQNSEDIMNSIVQEVFEEIHPQLSTDFKGTIISLLQKESREDMEKTLTDLDYPRFDDGNVNHILNGDKEFVPESDIDDSENDDDTEPTLDDNKEFVPESDINDSENNDDTEPTLDDGNDTATQKDDGGTDREPPSDDSNGKKVLIDGKPYPELIKDIVSPDAAEYKPDDESTYPDVFIDLRSAEDKKRGNIDEIVASIQDTEKKKKDRRNQITSISSKIHQNVRQKLIHDYDGKCQICFEKILNKSKKPHMRMRRLVFPHISDLGIPYEGNILALCPNCWAKLQKNYPWYFIKEGKKSNQPDFINVKYIEKNDREYVCIKIKIAGEDMYIHYKQNHFDKFKDLYENF